jgi:hypothetical protein
MVRNMQFTMVHGPMSDKYPAMAAAALRQLLARLKTLKI